MEKKSKQAYEQAHQVIPGGVNSSVGTLKSVGTTPLFFDKGEGALLTDVDGNEYIDLCASWGAAMVGHAHPQVVAAVNERIARGVIQGVPSLEESRLARKIVEMIPAIEQVRFANSSSEAVVTAVRLARAYTGKKTIIKFEGANHDHTDQLLIDTVSDAVQAASYLAFSEKDASAHHIITVPYNDEAAIKELFATKANEIAAIIVEPVLASIGVISAKDGFLHFLRDITRQHDAILIFDEVVTGFRLARGGASEFFDVEPDLIVLGKIIGGGFPLAALGGDADIISLLAPEGPVQQAGAFAGNPVVAEAGYQTLLLLDNPAVYEELNRKTVAFFQSLKAIVELYPVKLNAVGSMFTLYFLPKNPTSLTDVRECDLPNFAWFYRRLLREGIYFSPSQYEANFVTTAHSERQLRLVLIAVQRALSYVYGYVDNM
jgi:glutamate-1-semialdehyde 2,1-aminomutase